MFVYICREKEIDGERKKEREREREKERERQRERETERERDNTHTTHTHKCAHNPSPLVFLTGLNYDYSMLHHPPTHLMLIIYWWRKGADMGAISPACACGI
jgi:hypothetical protein